MGFRAIKALDERFGVEDGPMRRPNEAKEGELTTPREDEQTPRAEEKPDALDPNDSNLLRDQIKGQTTEHAHPPRLEDEGQSGG
jgi:hypothetical protein